MTPNPALRTPWLGRDPVGIGILGAARIATDGIVIPARATGSRLVAIAARDIDRARRFASEHGVEHAYDDYARVIDDPQVQLVYNPLANSLHAPWNLRAIAAGKHVLSEKPFARNAGEAQQVHAAGRAAGVFVADGFHYRYHPVFTRMIEIVGAGEIGGVTAIRATVVIPRPAPGDLRISPELAGGALMDGGCYALHAVDLIAALLLGPAQLESVEGKAFDDLPSIDETATATFALPRGAVGTSYCWMGGDRVELAIEVEGEDGSVRIPNFILPQDDDRVVLRSRAGELIREEHLGHRSSYTYQLEAVLRGLRHGAALPTDSADAVRTMTLVDECYRRIGMAPR